MKKKKFFRSIRHQITPLFASASEPSVRYIKKADLTQQVERIPAAAAAVGKERVQQAAQPSVTIGMIRHPHVSLSRGSFRLIIHAQYILTSGFSRGPSQLQLGRND